MGAEVEVEVAIYPEVVPVHPASLVRRSVERAARDPRARAAREVPMNGCIHS